MMRCDAVILWMWSLFVRRDYIYVMYIWCKVDQEIRDCIEDRVQQGIKLFVPSIEEIYWAVSSEVLTV